VSGGWTPDAVQVAVSDRGKGIPIAEQAAVFERFYRIDKGRQSNGLGIGLSNARDIAGWHQGSIEVESVPDVRTEFTLTLPKTD
jgi:two-component system sensor histidine kinase ArlS